ncbi:hypothetical protein C4D60_Mb06t03930 [Musa balbisiana]|uniref:Secreted protein n=1 Tax=Musa balbisiana TaxID=52838 RepID=A0A4S8IKD5_MUSBA|nr:hypothetical protein C4D60_Mb06t03930 [Musa balbisiana]
MKLRSLLVFSMIVGRYYSLESVTGAVSKATNYTSEIECNRDVSKNRKLYRVYVYVETLASKLIECRVFPAVCVIPLRLGSLLCEMLKVSTKQQFN